jgi:DnaJ-domain-containing protein 1
MVTPRRIPLAQQIARRAELDTLRLSRRLTPSEAAEADNLAQRLYMREFRRSLSQPRRQTHHAA